MAKILSLSKEDAENIIILRLNNGWSYNAISNKYNISTNSVKAIIKRGGLVKNRNRKYTVNESFFELINTEEKAYWLGFLYADGCVRLLSENNGELVIVLKSEDYIHLEKFRRSINFSGNVKFKKPNIHIKKKFHT